MDVEGQEGSYVKVERRVPRVLQRYSVYRIMTAKGNLLADSYKERPQTSPLATNL